MVSRASHFLQGLQSGELVFSELQIRAVQSFALLRGKIVRDLPESGMISQEDPQLVLHRIRLALQLPDSPAVHVPSQVDHAVLLQQIVIEFAGGDKLSVVGRLIVYLNGNTA